MKSSPFVLGIMYTLFLILHVLATMNSTILSEHIIKEETNFAIVFLKIKLEG